MVTQYKINPWLVINLDTADQRIVDFFNIKFGDLYHGELDTQQLFEISLIERRELILTSPFVLREITIPEICIFNDKQMFIVKNNKKIHIPFENIGKERNLTITYEKGFPLDWIRRLFEDVLDFHFVGHGAVLLHGACLVHKDTEIIMPAWRGTGKTTLLPHLATQNKYLYKAEDQFFLFSDQTSHVLTDAAHVDYKTITNFPELKKYNSLSFWFRSGIAKMLLPLIPPNTVLLEFLRRGIIKVLAPKIFIKLKDFIPITLTHEQVKKKILLKLVSQKNLKTPTITKIDLDVIVKMLIGGMAYERLDLWPYYYAWNFATGQENDVFGRYYEKTYEILTKGLADSDCYQVNLPVGYNWNEKLLDLEELWMHL